jgi:hypothetical protein
MPKATKQQTDLELLFEERQAGDMPWTRTPFVRGLAVPGPDDEIEELQPGELRVKAPEEVPWIGKVLISRVIGQCSLLFASDLLLEIAMTTAFASLT